MRRVIIMGPSWVVLVCLISASTLFHHGGPALSEAASVSGANIISNSSNVPAEAINMTIAMESNPSSSPDSIIGELVDLPNNNDENIAVVSRAAEPKHHHHEQDDDDDDDNDKKHKDDDDDDDDDHEDSDKKNKKKNKVASTANNNSLSITETILEGNSSISKRPCPLSHRLGGNSSLLGNGSLVENKLTSGTALEKISESIVGVMSTIKNSVTSIFSPGTGLPEHGLSEDMDCNGTNSTNAKDNSTLEITIHPAAGEGGIVNTSSSALNDTAAVVQPVSVPEGSNSTTEIPSVPTTTAPLVSSTPLAINETDVVKGNLTDSNSTTTSTTTTTTTGTPLGIGL